MDFLPIFLIVVILLLSVVFSPPHRLYELSNLVNEGFVLDENGNSNFNYVAKNKGHIFYSVNVITRDINEAKDYKIYLTSLAPGETPLSAQKWILNKQIQYYYRVLKLEAFTDDPKANKKMIKEKRKKGVPHVENPSEIGLEYADHLYNTKKTRDLKNPDDWLQIKFYKPKRPKTGTEKNKEEASRKGTEKNKEKDSREATEKNKEEDSRKGTEKNKEEDTLN